MMQYAHRYRPKVIYKYPNGDSVLLDQMAEDLSEMDVSDL